MTQNKKIAWGAVGVAIVVGLAIFVTLSPIRKATKTAIIFNPGSTFTVNSTGDGADASLSETPPRADGICRDATGKCTLRAAIQEANANHNAAQGFRDIINFDVGGHGTISPATRYDMMNESVSIVGSSTADGAKLTTISGASTQSSAVFFVEHATGAEIKGLAFNGFSEEAILFVNVTDGVISDNYIGTNVNGSAAIPNTNGIAITDSHGGVISNNIVSGNTNIAIDIERSDGIQVLNSNIGLNKEKTAALPNGNGIQLVQSSNAIIDSNVIAGGTGIGIAIQGVGSDPTQGNTITKNFIGVNDASAPFPNTQGILLDSTQHNKIGTSSVDGWNVIAANKNNDVFIRNGSTENQIAGNYIGTDKNGIQSVPSSGGYGIHIDSSSNNTIGGLTAEESNIISGDNCYRVSVEGSSSSGNTIQGNYIGTKKDGLAAIENGNINGGGVDCAGIAIVSASNTLIGGANQDAGNLISGGGGGIHLIGAINTSILGNLIGTDKTGNATIGNTGQGIYLSDTSTGNLIGGPASYARNIISGNKKEGVYIVNSGTEHNAIQGNYIGANKDGSSGIPNQLSGVHIDDGAALNEIGGTNSGESNVIAYNNFAGVELSPTAGSGNSILGNSIYGNKGNGIEMYSSGNDQGDGDTGPNNLQNRPVLSIPIPSINKLGINLNSTPHTNFRLELFLCDESGYRQGEKLLWSQDNVSTNATGDSSPISYDIPMPDMAGKNFTATATRMDGNVYNDTSDFSQCVKATAADVAIKNMTVDKSSVSAGDQVTFSISVENKGPDDAPNVSLPLHQLPAGLTYISHQATKGTYNPQPQAQADEKFAMASGTKTISDAGFSSQSSRVLAVNPNLTWVIGGMSANTTETLQITARAESSLAGQTATLATGNAAADAIDPVAANNTGSASVKVNQPQVSPAPSSTPAPTPSPVPSTSSTPVPISTPITSVKPTPSPTPTPISSPSSSSNRLLASPLNGAPHVRSFTPKGAKDSPQTNFYAYTSKNFGGVDIATGDFDHDGVDEIMTGSGKGLSPEIRIFKKSGKLISKFSPFPSTYTQGLSVAAGDVNGDGIPDFGVCIAQSSQALCKVFLNISGRPLVAYFNAFGTNKSGADIAMGDVDGDGRSEVIVGQGPGGAPLVRVFDIGTKSVTNLNSGISLKSIQITAFDAKNRSGIKVAAADTTGDNKAEIAVSQNAPDESWIKLFSYTQKKTVLANFRAFPQGQTSGATIAMADLTGDGKAELIVGQGPTRPPSIKVFTTTGSLLYPPFLAFRKDFLGGINVGAGRF